MPNISNRSKCTGCGACYNICPQNAITMKGDKFGFYKPHIDIKKCVECKFCEKVCPLNKSFTQDSEPQSFALINRDEKTRIKCASGGAFALFATYIIKNGGIVYGVVFDENIIACHIRANNLIDLEKMYSSKYVQSNTKKTFKQVKEDLENDKLVLYSGTPCQIAGLKLYLGKDYKKLLTIDLICHGVQSPMLFEKYKQEFMHDKNDETLLNVNFRSKHAGWSIHYLTHYTTTTTTTTRDYHTPQDYWVKIMNHSFNESCGYCQFNKSPRIADISIGDFWGVDEYDKTLNDDKGTSIVIINNNKGKCALTFVKNECLLQEIPFEIAIKRNQNIIRSSIAHPKREAFLEDVCIKNKNIVKCANKYLKTPFYITLYNLLPESIKDIIKYKILKMEKK